MSNAKTLSAFCLVIACFGAPFLSGLEASRYTVPQVVNPAIDAVLDTADFREVLLPEELVKKHESALKETLQQISQLHSQHAREKKTLVLAQCDEIQGPAKIADLSNQLNRVQSDIDRLDASVRELRAEHAEFKSTVAQRIERITKEAIAARDMEYDNAVERIAEARRQRNEHRVQVGARREDQSEVQHTLNERRRAKENAEQNCLATITRANDAIDSQNLRFVAKIESEANQYDCNTTLKSNLQKQLAAAQVQLNEARSLVAALPSKIEQLEVELEISSNKLSDLRDSLEVARRDRDEKTKQISKEKELDQQFRLAKIGLNDLPTSTLRNNEQIAAISPAEFNFRPSLSSRYYDPSYRPPVGNHFVSGYRKQNGTYVSGHYRTINDDSFWNNWSSHGNVNPYTNRVGSHNPPTYVSPSFRNGRFVSGHFRRH